MNMNPALRILRRRRSRRDRGRIEDSTRNDLWACDALSIVEGGIMGTTRQAEHSPPDGPRPDRRVPGRPLLRLAAAVVGIVAVAAIGITPATAHVATFDWSTNHTICKGCTVSRG